MLQKSASKFVICLITPLQGEYVQRKQSLCTNRYLNTHVNCLTIRSRLSQGINIQQRSSTGDQIKVWDAHTEEYCLAIREEGNPIFCIKVDGAG